MVKLAMTDDEQFGAGTHAKQQKAIFVGCVGFIEELNGEFIVKD